MQNDPIFKKEQEETQKRWEAYQEKALKNKRRKRDLISDYRSIYPIDYDQNFVIPVVFHIIYDEEITPEKRDYNNDRIKDLLKYVNEVYAGIEPRTKNYKNGGVYIPIQFALAKSTPDNQPTDGIYHIDGRNLHEYIEYGLNTGNNKNGATEQQIEATSHFPRNFALNIYIINKMSENVLSKGYTITTAYAYVGGHGTVWCNYKFAKRGETTLPHELGHSLSLKHLFACSGTCQANKCPKDTNNCHKDNDGICDTEPTIAFKQRNQKNNINPCTQKPYEGGDFNIMHYAKNVDRFTPGQVYKMIFELKDNNLKQSLLRSPALNPPTQNINIVSAKCTPSHIKYPKSNSGMGITNVEFGNLKYKSGSLQYDGYKFYIDHTKDKGLNNIKFIAGRTYRFKIGKGTNPHKIFAFIDYNNDGNFNYGNEKVFETQLTYSDSDFTVKIPSENVVMNTPIRLRVVDDWAYANLRGGACAFHEDGQTEDFAITIVPDPFDKETSTNKVGINTTKPETALDVVSQNNGVLFPRMSSEQMFKISTPAMGMLVYNLDQHCLAVNYGKETPRWRCLDTEVISSFKNSMLENNHTSSPSPVNKEGKIGINTTEPNAALHVNSEFFGVQFPRLNNDEIKNINNPEEGLLLYNTSENCLSINIGPSNQPIWKCLKIKR
ncbi:GEVED domain-containing protein [Ornithobacterium rhinotracheale]|uniref:GEVED domain-containing protein n=1 Tax=Ornithobacterium rhinotracheale TaxID=28251 RepID=UPI001FF6F0DA|nr:GEVED domain-containing protein [Ornithobacterium rhinotracheale]MCK0205870.1 GEVED domain-containing protein [Ornithobacterium rhinotracheale]